MTRISQDINYPAALFPKSFNKSMADEMRESKCNHKDTKIIDGGGVSGSYIQCQDCNKIIK